MNLLKAPQLIAVSENYFRGLSHMHYKETLVSGDKILIGVCGSIAAYKAIDIAKKFEELGFAIKIVLSKSAENYVSENTLRALFPKKVFLHNQEFGDSDDILHITLAKWADYILVAPATANTIAKLSCGLADCLLSNIWLACTAKKIIAPAMNMTMLENITTQQNLKNLIKQNITVILPEFGKQACGDVGLGRLANINQIIDAVKYIDISCNLIGKTIVITAGGTREKIDPVRYISNYSSGKMGLALAKIAGLMGAKVHLITTVDFDNVAPSVSIHKIESAQEMLKESLKLAENSDYFVGAAAVSDYTPKMRSSQKIKKTQENLEFELVKTPDIIKEVKAKFPKITVVGFAAETENFEANALKKLKTKTFDFIALNDVSNGNVFGQDYNALKVFHQDGTMFEIARDTKENVALQLLSLLTEK